MGRGGRGCLTKSEKRQEILEWVAEAVANGCSKEQACQVLGISIRTLQNWKKQDDLPDGRTTRQITPGNKFSPQKRAEVLKRINSSEFRDLGPNQIVPILADKDEYLASESSMYRILKQEQMTTHRQNSRPATRRHRPEPYTADAANQIWSWDITYLPTQVKGTFLYLYLIMDIYSRKIVGWEVHDVESSEYAAQVASKAYRTEGIKGCELVLHSDNGSPMKGATMLATLQRLGIVPSFSRPSVSNDNPYSESLFRTLKYRPEYPCDRFEDHKHARQWVVDFVHWYNHDHRHSAIKFVTPHQRHTGQDISILAGRKEVYEKAKTANPHHWTGETRNWEPVKTVSLNPVKGKETADACVA